MQECCLKIELTIRESINGKRQFFKLTSTFLQKSLYKYGNYTVYLAEPKGITSIQG